MGFKLRDQADQWFKEIIRANGPFKVKFDAYYLCLMLGLVSGKRDNPSHSTEFVDYFVSDYAASGKVIVAMMVLVEAKRLRLKLDEKEQMKNLLDDYLDAKSSTLLSEKGFNRLNEYASGGFNLLFERFQERPRHIEYFLEEYLRLFKEYESVGM